MRTDGRMKKSRDDDFFLVEQSNGTPLTRIQRVGAPLQSGVFFQSFRWHNSPWQGYVSYVNSQHFNLLVHVYTCVERDTENKASR